MNCCSNMVTFPSIRKVVIISGVAVAAGAWWIGQQRQAWRDSIASFESTLLTVPTALNLHPNVIQTLSDLPVPVQRFLHLVFPGETESTEASFAIFPLIRSLHMQQTGKMFFNGKWVSFTARQVISTDNLGFVWEALSHMGPLPGVWVQVCDAWVNGRGYLRVALFGAIPIVSPPDEEALKLGEMLRWLAETVFVPTIFLPQESSASRPVVLWKAAKNSSDQAILVLHDSRMPGGTNAEVTFSFDKDGWIHKMECRRPRAVDNGLVMSDWVGYFSNYTSVEGMMIPLHGEVGWILDGKEELYFKGDNYDLQFGFFERNGAQQVEGDISNTNENRND